MKDKLILFLILKECLRLSLLRIKSVFFATPDCIFKVTQILTLQINVLIFLHRKPLLHFGSKTKSILRLFEVGRSRVLKRRIHTFAKNNIFLANC